MTKHRRVRLALSTVAWAAPARAEAVERAGLRALAFVPPLVVAAGLIIGIHYGSFAAAGSDSYGYVSQASLWLHGTLRIEQPIVDKMSWEGRGYAFAPLGYRPIASESSTIVPTYSPGLPILMALFLCVIGPDGPFYVVPVLGALALWLTYRLGVDFMRSRAAGAGAALLLLASPVFLAHLMLPMTDVPMAAAWTLIMYLALKDPRPKPIAAGLAAAAALLMRPNLLLLVGAPVAAWLWPCVRGRNAWRDGIRDVLLFAAGMAPAILAVALINTRLYGSPIQSGYGGLTGDMYELGRGPQNLRLYVTWLIRSQTALVALAIVPFVMRDALRSDSPRASVRAGIGALILLSLISYIFYYVFDVWFYLRFLLPALPALLVMMVAGIRWVTARLPWPAARAPVAALLCLTCCAFGIRFGRSQSIFEQRQFERRHIRAAEYVAQLTPPNAVILAVQHSGSVRYYAHRITLRYDALDPHLLDATLRELKDKGYPPFIVVDDWEENEFRGRFAAQSEVGKLQWRPLARIATSPEVHIYDPEGRAKP